MSNKAFPFDAVQASDGTYDREYNSSDWASYFSKFVGTGIYADKGNAFQVQADNTSMFVTIKDGACFIKGREREYEDDVLLRLENSDASYDRIDNVVIQLSIIDRTIEIKVITGTASASPKEPTLTRNDDIYELLLANVLVESGVTTISQANITDRRNDSEVCGWVIGALQQIDAQSFFEQYELAFNEWFSEMKNMLDDNVATNLLNRCEELETGKAEKPTLVNYTLLGSAWSGTSAPYTYTLTVSGVTSTSCQDIALATNPTTAQVEAYSLAKIVDGGQSTNTIVLKAHGDKPTISIPIRVVLRGEVNA